MEIQITITDSNSSAQQQLDELRAERAALLEANHQLSLQVQELQNQSRPALPEGMRIAESEDFGRVVVSPDTDNLGDYRVFFLTEGDPTQADYEHAKPSDLTFLN